MLKFTLNHNRSRVAKTILNKKKKTTWKHHKPDFKAYCKVIVIEIAWYWHKNKCKGHWKRIESPEISSLRMQLTDHFRKVLRPFSGVRIGFQQQQNCVGNIEHVRRRMKLASYLSIYTKLADYGSKR